MPLLDYLQAKKLLDKYGISSIDSKYVNSAGDAAAFSGGKGIVLKLISDKAIHKSKEGLVKLDLRGKGEIAAAFNYLVRKGEKLRPYKILAQKMSGGGIEMIIGGSTDKQFGRMLLVGLGGVYVETFKDVELRLCPIKKDDAREMLADLKSGGVVTYKGAATEMLASLLTKVSALLVENEDVTELDLNPVIVREASYDVVDIRVIR
jgi:succinyl-CoA synthetase beta subunit